MFLPCCAHAARLSHEHCVCVAQDHADELKRRVAELEEGHHELTHSLGEKVEELGIVKESFMRSRAASLNAEELSGRVAELESQHAEKDAELGLVKESFMRMRAASLTAQELGERVVELESELEMAKELYVYAYMRACA